MLWPFTLAVLIVFVVCVLVYVFRRDIAYLFGKAEKRLDSEHSEITQAYHEGLEDK